MIGKTYPIRGYVLPTGIRLDCYTGFGIEMVSLHAIACRTSSLNFIKQSSKIYGCSSHLVAHSCKLFLTAGKCLKSCFAFSRLRVTTIIHGLIHGDLSHNIVSTFSAVQWTCSYFSSLFLDWCRVSMSFNIIVLSIDIYLV